MANNSEHTLGGFWDDFEEQLLKPIGAGEHQIMEMRKAFYAGGAVMFNLITDVAGSLDDDDACAFMSKLEAEIKTFLNKVLGTPDPQGTYEWKSRTH